MFFFVAVTKSSNCEQLMIIVSIKFDIAVQCLSVSREKTCNFLPVQMPPITLEFTWQAVGLLS